MDDQPAASDRAPVEPAPRQQPYTAQPRSYKATVILGEMTHPANDQFAYYIQRFALDLAREADLLLEEVAHNVSDPEIRPIKISEKMVREAYEVARRPAPFETLPDKTSPPDDNAGRRRYLIIQLVSLVSVIAAGVLGSYIKEHELVRLAFYISVLVAIASTAYYAWRRP